MVDKFENLNFSLSLNTDNQKKILNFAKIQGLILK